MEDLLRDAISFRLASAYRRVDRFCNRAFARLGLTHAHGHLLACLLQEGEQRVIDLAQKTGFEASTVSRLLKELTRRKLVRRRRHPDDGRAQLLWPAKRAEALRPAIETVLRRANERLRRELPDEDLAGFLGTISLMERLP